MSEAAQGGAVRAALLADGLAAWTGGTDFLRLCVSGLQAVAPCQQWQLLLTVQGTPARRAARAVKRWVLRRPYPGQRVAESRIVLEEMMRGLGLRAKVHLCRRTAPAISKSMRSAGADVLFPCMKSLGADFPVAWVGYIPDLQHRRLPQFFSEAELAGRDGTCQALLNDARAIVLNARAVARDIEEFYPVRRARFFVLPFCPAIQAAAPGADGQQKLAGYDLPAKFFLISNQFWIHKSHQTAFAALKMVRDAGYEDVHILCTGNTHDYRWPEHFQNLMQGLERDRMLDRVRFLGVLPKSDQLAIMRRSLAVIQPTLFEGGPGGGSVYDAVATSTPAIVSDIPVNREVDLGVVDFFSVGSAEDLAAKMIRYLESPPARWTMEDTQSALRRRQREMGQALLEVLSFAASAGEGVRQGMEGGDER